MEWTFAGRADLWERVEHLLPGQLHPRSPPLLSTCTHVSAICPPQLGLSPEITACLFPLVLWKTRLLWWIARCRDKSRTPLKGLEPFPRQALPSLLPSSFVLSVYLSLHHLLLVCPLLYLLLLLLSASFFFCCLLISAYIISFLSVLFFTSFFFCCLLISAYVSSSLSVLFFTSFFFCCLLISAYVRSSLSVLFFTSFFLCCLSSCSRRGQFLSKALAYYFLLFHHIGEWHFPRSILPSYLLTFIG